MSKELPWLADNAQLELKHKKGKTPLSHRRWQGEPVPVVTASLIQTKRRKISPGIMINVHWSGSPPSSRQLI